MNEEDKNTEITATRSLVPEGIIDASTPINVLSEPSLTHNNYLDALPPHFFRLLISFLLELHPKADM
ncbi:hypothetical protein OYC64_018340 [Pagothenia borchgrevinki]|uniref:Uncharacterized protein n=1 Tax=Pagothenia borchgrevinki TaxID=8213 RepID=A0ABD2GPM7_PAGBO